MASWSRGQVNRSVPFGACRAILVLGVIGLGAGLLGTVLLRDGGSEAPEFVPPSKKKKKTPEVNTPEKNDPTYGLPLEITIEDVPEVPEEILGPFPAVDQKE